MPKVPAAADVLEPTNSTAGLNVPLASQPASRGEMIGSSDARLHAPKGSFSLSAAVSPKAETSAGMASTAARLVRSSRFLATRCMLRLFRGLAANQPLAFLNEDDLVRGDVLQGIHDSAGPLDFEQVHFAGLAEAEVHAQVILGEITASAANFVDLLVRFGLAGRLSYA